MCARGEVRTVGGDGIAYGTGPPWHLALTITLVRPSRRQRCSSSGFLSGQRERLGRAVMDSVAAGGGWQQTLPEMREGIGGVEESGAAGVPHSTGHVDIGGNQGAEGGEELLQSLPRQHLVHVVEVEAPREGRVKGHEEHSNQALAQRAKPVKAPPSVKAPQIFTVQSCVCRGMALKGGFGTEGAQEEKREGGKEGGLADDDEARSYG